MRIRVVESSTEHPMPKFVAIMILEIIGSSAVLERAHSCGRDFSPPRA